MNPDVVYAKTAKGLEEISQRTYRLPARMRSLLIMVDGKVPAAELIGRSMAPDEAAANLALLFNEGFIDAKSIGPSQAAAPGLPPVAADTLEQGRRFIVASMVSALGPDAVHFTAKVEGARDMAELIELAPKYLEVIRVGGGSKKAEAFRAGLVELGVLLEQGDTTAGSKAVPAPATVEELNESARLANAKKTIIRFLLATLGPDADRFTGKVEAAATTAELKQLAARHLELIRGTVGPRKAEEFRQQVSEALNS